MADEHRRKRTQKRGTPAQGPIGLNVNTRMGDDSQAYEIYWEKTVRNKTNQLGRPHHLVQQQQLQQQQQHSGVRLPINPPTPPPSPPPQIETYEMSNIIDRLKMSQSQTESEEFCNPSPPTKFSPPPLPSPTTPSTMPPPFLPQPKTSSNSKPNPKLAKTINNLITKQRRELPAAVTELNRYGLKRTHWVWWAFPTEQAGRLESTPKTNVTFATATQLVRNAPPVWRECLELIAKLVKSKGIIVLPEIDHDRVRYFIQFWESKKHKNVCPLWLGSVLDSLRPSFYEVPADQQHLIPSPPKQQQPYKNSLNSTMSEYETDIARAIAKSQSQGSNIFGGLNFLCDGRSVPTEPILRNLIHLNGGDLNVGTMENHKGETTHILCETVSTAIGKSARKSKRKLFYIRPEYIVDCINRGSRCSEQLYVVDEVSGVEWCVWCSVVW